jgi:hypothetical protein
MMRSAEARVLTLALGLYAVGVMRLEAHHSFAAEYDGTKPITVTGAVTKIDWTNPHIYLYIDVKNETGAITSWKFEGYPGGEIQASPERAASRVRVIENNEDLIRFEKLLQTEPLLNRPPQ